MFEIVSEGVWDNRVVDNSFIVSYRYDLEVNFVIKDRVLWFIFIYRRVIIMNFVFFVW